MQWKFPWILKVLLGTMNVSKELKNSKYSWNIVTVSRSAGGMSFNVIVLLKQAS